MNARECDNSIAVKKEQRIHIIVIAAQFGSKASNNKKKQTIGTLFVVLKVAWFSKCNMEKIMLQVRNKQTENLKAVEYKLQSYVMFCVKKDFLLLLLWFLFYCSRMLKKI